MHFTRKVRTFLESEGILGNKPTFKDLALRLKLGLELVVKVRLGNMGKTSQR